MITLFIILCLILGVIIGYRRSLVLQSLHAIGTICSLAIAAICYAPFSKQLHLILPYPSASTEGKNTIFNNINNENAFYNIMAILILFVFTKVILQIVATVFDFYHQMDFGGKYARYFGMALGFIEAYLVVIIMLAAIAVIPVPTFIDAFHQSSIGNVILSKTPFLSEQLVKWLSN
ncbi:CvpA family protein [Mammaliicoccus vitulinus]|uniref:CvpA family protein n=1 Tax=Mammaliicoccus vitulinus TaxID=71237 RepID=UPI003B9FC791